MDDFFHDFENKSVYYCSNPGNAGDAVIALATYQMFKKYNINVNIISKSVLPNLKNETIFFGGGGNLIKGLYTDMYNVIMHYVDDNICYILPSTIYGYEDLLLKSNNNLTIICRDKTSYQLSYLVKSNNKNLFLSDDLAFYLDPCFYQKFIKKPSCNNSSFFSIGYCLRTDGESAKAVYIPDTNRDISLSWNGDLWDNFDLTLNVVKSLLSYLSLYDKIITDRLHIAILSTLISKVVVLYPNSYYKNRAVFENSFSKYSNANFISTSPDLFHSEYIDELFKRNNLIF